MWWILNALYHEEADMPSLIPQMLEAFLRSDKLNEGHAASIREQAARAVSPLPSAGKPDSP